MAAAASVGGDSGGGKEDLLRVEVLVSEESSLVEESELSEFDSESDSESDSSVELTGWMVS